MMTHFLDSWSLKLIEQYKVSSLAPFYIITAPATGINASDFLKKWTNAFSLEVISFEKKKPSVELEYSLALGHGDLINLCPNEDYKIDSTEIQGFFKAMEFKPLEFTHKLIFLQNADTLSKTISNKMLKTLEEPQKNTTVFFLKNTQNQLMPTITSRAISIQLQLPASSYGHFNLQPTAKKLEWFKEKIEVHSKLKKNETLILNLLNDCRQVHDVLLLCKKDPGFEKTLFSVLVEWATVENSHYSKKQNILNEIKWYNKSNTFHNNVQERIYGLLKAIV